MYKRKRILLAVLLIFCLQAYKCDESARAKAAKATDSIATLIGSVIDTKRELAFGPTCTVQKVCITQAEELELTLYLKQANDAVRKFKDYAQAQTDDTPQTKLNLAKAFEEVTKALNLLSTKSFFPIKNEDAKKKFLAILNSINTSVQIIEAALR